MATAADTANLSETEAAELIVISLARKADPPLDPATVARALKFSERTYYRRLEALQAIEARRDVEHDLDEAACR